MITDTYSAQPISPDTYSAQGASADQSAKATLDSFLSNYGLSGLGDFAWNEYLNNVPLPQIMLDIRQTPTYKTRFPAMDSLAQRGQAITEAQYINFEQSAQALWTRAGLPPDQLRQGDYVTKWLEGDVSLNEVQDRIGNLYTQVAQAPQEVRDWYAQQFGPTSDAALAASFADSATAAPVLERQVAEAQFGGTGARYGYGIDELTARRAAQAGVSAAQAQQGFQQIQAMNPLFRETVSENNDLTGASTGVGAVFGLDPTSQEALLQRAAEREAAFKGSTSAGGIVTTKGSGLGTANQSG